MDAIGVPGALGARIEGRAVRCAVRPRRRSRDGIINPGISRRGVPILTSDLEEELDASRRVRRALRVVMTGESVTRSQIQRSCCRNRIRVDLSQESWKALRSSPHPHVRRIETQPELHVRRLHPRVN